ncbi:ABC transporter permease [Jeotgalibaca sp. MA1X17-3]|uniref:ABC transporter permease n=1 Tax=Jeotgalibaca sp. MA1X17-3 TaxID=2908211 RepID=UPI001F3718DA|nr:ABC transporter permease [Jeotgalibaca sp. MA1X17-3]UJF14612.1 ABC transporter permease [Jeotgalibaca sp. MA1X17-3]
MFKKIGNIFIRDVKVNMKDFISLYVMVVPIIFAMLINIFTPGINETTVSLALVNGNHSDQIEYLEDFAKVERFDTVEEVQERVEKRDHLIGIIPEGNDYYLMTQGNEPEEMVDYATLLQSFYILDIKVEDSNSKLTEFNRTVPPLKKVLVNVSILFISVLAGMLIALNIVEEKVDRTIRAINVTPTTKLEYILGKSVMGVIFSLFGSIALIFITGFGGINLLQFLLILIVTSLLSILVGFIQGLTSSDIITAAGSIKLLFLPLIAGVLAVEILGEKWQKFFYWDPFYWAYKGNDLILSQSGTWQQVSVYAGIAFLISGVVFLILAPKIKKGLQ